MTRSVPDSSDVTWRGIRSRMTLLKKGSAFDCLDIEPFETNVKHEGHSQTVADVSQSHRPGAFRIASKIPQRRLKH